MTRFITTRDIYVIAVLAVMEVIGRIPSAALAGRLVRGIGEFAHAASRGKREGIVRGLDEIFGDEFTEDARDEIARRVFHEFWRDCFSLTPWGGRRLRDIRVEVRGLDHLERARSDGRGAVLWESAYLGQRHLSKWILAKRGWRVDQVHLDLHAAGFGTAIGGWTRVGEKVVKRRVDRYEAATTSDLITLHASHSLAFTRVIRDRLLRNRVLAVTGDVFFGRSFVRHPILGGIGKFPTGMISLCRTTGTPLLPLFCIEEPGDHVTLSVESPIDVPANAGRDALMDAAVSDYSERLERQIRRFPGSYRKWDRLEAGGWERVVDG